MVIFLAGVHGVGKTYLGEPVAKELGINYASASSLIKKGLNNDQVWLEDKRTKNIDNNQQILINAVNKLVVSNNTPLLLDGHFVLRNEHGDLTKLPASVFQELNISSVILFEVPKNTISERLANRGTPQSIKQIKELKQAERGNAEQICQSLNIPLFILEMPTKEKLLSILMRLIKCSTSN